MPGFSFPTVPSEHTFFSLLLEDFFVGFDFQSSKVKVSTSGKSQCIPALADLKCVALIAGQYLCDIRRKQEEN